MKRSFLSLFDTASSAYDTPVCLRQNPRKMIKACLQIDIADSFAEKSLPTTTNVSARKISFSGLSGTQPSRKTSFNSLSAQPCCMVKTLTTPRHSERGHIAPEPNSFVMENDFMYEDFSQEEEAFNITMKKCNRRRMEDRVTCETRVDSFGRSSFFFGIYDGHRNSYVSDYLQGNLHKVFQSCPEITENPASALKEAFNRIDKEVLKNQEALNIPGGSTALCAYINGKSLHLANVGDSKAIIIRKGAPVALNIEHRANNEEERKNVENRGGFVFEKKGPKASRFLVQGALELTRSIGDPSYKEFITCEPDVLEYKFDKDDEHMIMASDGFWNEINEEETVDLVNKFGDSQGLSKFLVNEAMKKKHYNIDNISLIAIDIQQFLKNLNGLTSEN